MVTITPTETTSVLAWTDIPPSSKKLRFPSFVEYQRRSLERREAESFQTAVLTHMNQWALRWLNKQGPLDANSLGRTPMTLDEMKDPSSSQHAALLAHLTDALEKHAYTAGSKSIHSRYDLESTAKTCPLGIWDEDVPDLCANAAQWAIQKFDLTYKQQRAKWGAAGGAMSVRPKEYLPELLDDVLGFSAPVQAELLGVSLSTVARLRRGHPYYIAAKQAALSDKAPALSEGQQS
ncbi:hypothetical protein DOU02_06655 [Clavibacter michiganensis subsp. michiganensis]|uniref:hypothetical protein n=1 Tax=Clavibacter michiganensis TaxID=28447 RepID=UPI001303C527|nr:hypothetical protein [Clavibacter michiganensis]KAF0258758.1 hypothetical protein DOU02_06655 [Clavibacter michiganensis subsp. michiganensis]